MIELKNPYEGWMRGLWTAAAILPVILLAALGAYSVSEDAKEVAFIMALIDGTLLVLVLLALPVMYFMGRSDLKKIRKLVIEGNHWAHWHYGQDEWQRFTESEWARMRGKARTLPLKVLAIFLVVGVLLSFTSENDMTVAEGLLFGGILGVPLGLLVGVLMYLFGRAIYHRRLANVGEAYIGAEGIYQDGHYLGLKGFGLTLQKVELEQGDPSVLHFEVRDSRGRRTTTTEVRVAVPRGQEAQAEELARRFKIES